MLALTAQTVSPTPVKSLLDKGYKGFIHHFSADFFNDSFGFSVQARQGKPVRVARVNTKNNPSFFATGFVAAKAGLSHTAFAGWYSIF